MKITNVNVEFMMGNTTEQVSRCIC